MNAIGKPALAHVAIAAAGPARDLPTRDLWVRPLVVLAICLAVLGAVFAEEASEAVRLWNASTAYNHCWLVAPIAAWLAWSRRHRLASLTPVPAPLFAVLAIPGTIAWFAAERLGIMEGRQLVAYGLVIVTVVTVLGWRFGLAFAAPLSYLIFLVPFGGFAVVPLQYITAHFIDVGLTVLGITHYTDGLLIETTAGLFHVAEACAGLRFIIAALAFGALYAFVIFRSPWRRAVVMALALIVPVIANGIRALGIVLVAEYLGSAEAAAADHIIYGWGFFSAVILLLILAGLPFREDHAPPAPIAAPVGPRIPATAAALAASAILVVGLTAAGPAAAGVLSTRAAAVAEPTARLAAPRGCIASADGASLTCEGLVVTARLIVFPAESTWKAVSTARWAVSEGMSDQDLTFTVAADGVAWRARQANTGGEAAASASWLGGRAVGDGLGTRLAQAQNSLRGGDGRPVLAVVRIAPSPDAATPPTGQQARALLEAVLAAQGNGLTAQAQAASR